MCFKQFMELFKISGVRDLRIVYPGDGDYELPHEEIVEFDYDNQADLLKKYGKFIVKEIYTASDGKYSTWIRITLEFNRYMYYMR